MASDLCGPTTGAFHWDWTGESLERRKARQDMKAELIPLGPLQQGNLVPIPTFPFVIGRSGDAEMQIDDRWSSRRHCEIDEVDGTLIVRDLASSNGTLVNGVAICTSPLLPGDELAIGISVFKVSYLRDASKVAPPVIYALPCRPQKPRRSVRSDLATSAKATHVRLGGLSETVTSPDLGSDPSEAIGRDLDSSPTT